MYNKIFQQQNAKLTTFKISKKNFKCILLQDLLILLKNISH